MKLGVSVNLQGPYKTTLTDHPDSGGYNIRATVKNTTSRSERITGRFLSLPWGFDIEQGFIDFKFPGKSRYIIYRGNPDKPFSLPAIPAGATLYVEGLVQPTGHYRPDYPCQPYKLHPGLSLFAPGAPAVVTSLVITENLVSHPTEPTFCPPQPS